MKTFTLKMGLALGLLLCGNFKLTAQPPPTPAPIIIQLAEIDRCRVATFTFPKTNSAPRLGIPYRTKDPYAVHTLVSNSLALHLPVLIMDGQTLIASGTPVAGYSCYRNPWDTGDTDGAESGFALEFASAEETQKVNAILRSEPNVDDLNDMIRSHKKHLLNESLRNEIFF